jgi:hypothetical protein
MPWTRIILITFACGIVTSMTDWFFAGDWIHRRFTYPEIWRQGAEARAIALTSPLPFLTCGVFSCLCASLRLHSIASSLELAIAIWLLAPLPLILTNAAFIKLHRVFVMSLATGWLVKLSVVGIASGLFLK